MAAVFMLPVDIHAEEEKVVRVGWFESPFNLTDQFGRRSGYSYEYQRKIAAYTGWTYEYVEDSWSELMTMLINGEIDLMSDVSYKEDRADKMLYTSLPMGSEVYRIYITPDNTDISADDYSTLNGKRIGVTKNSVQKDLFINWQERHGIRTEIVDLTSSEDESLQMVREGRLDAFITLDAYSNEEDVVPICKIGSSDFYFVVNKNRPDLLNELDSALNLIQDENRNFNQQLYEKYLWTSSTNMYLSSSEREWLEDHGTIRVGYQDNYLAFCAKDSNTGELIGALKDYLDYASTCMENADLHFEAIGYPTAAAALEALVNNEVDCMFPANLHDFEGEQLGVVMTPALMTTEMDAVVRESDQKEFIKKEDISVAVNEGNTNYEMFLTDNYPGWTIHYYADTPAGLDGIAAGKTDCVIISNYRYNNISKQCEKLHLTTVYTGVDMEYYLAVREGDTELYSILTRVTGIVPESIVHAALTYYSTEDVKVGFMDFIRDNFAAFMLAAAMIMAIFTLLILRSIRAEREALNEHRKVTDLSKKVYVDSLTSVKNKGAYGNYIASLQAKLDNREPLEYAVAAFDCDNLKAINDQYGHDKGDIYLKSASKLICRIFAHSPVFRIGGDEFAVIMENEDYENREQLVDEFLKAKEEICETRENPWEQVRTSVGLAVFDPDNDRSVMDTVRRADKYMYENKWFNKENQQ
ncbi:MAG: transporter substrate-binding domain-containing protein [Erysipelotrichaceae bacterium]|nr:transporter substrate-binding domain-containing protein [Erysipelotrichaceae bacterium]